MKQTKTTEVPGLLRVGIYLFDKVELLDFAGPYEVFSVTSELNDFGMFQVFTISRDGRPVQTISGLKVIVDYSFDNHPPIDLLVIPGGVGTRSEVKKEMVIDWIKRMHRQNQITMSVCSGSILLGKAGLLDDMESVTHHEVFELLEKAAPRTIINPDERWIDNDRVMTSAGISAGIDLSLHLVEKLYGSEVKKRTVIYMEYGDWKKYTANK
ncbi:MAG: DJ-1/PfpI family protein [Bacillota bacterium]|nr:DJ-1/PfpI family protein [Bacillota bacterium]MDW7676172.1 DJ-1/PfpI family protein [Bacillota bacterium]